MECHIWDLPEDIVRLKIESRVRKEIFERASNFFGSKKRLAKTLDIQYKELWRYETGRLFLPLKILQKMLDYSNPSDKEEMLKTIERNLKEIKGGSNSYSIKNPKFPIKLSTTLVQITGNLIGDGGISLEGTTYRVYYSNDYELLIRRFEKGIKELFGEVEYSSFTDENGCTTLKFPTIIGIVLVRMLGHFAMEPKFIPECLFENSKKIKTIFLQALFDDEGWVAKNQQRIGLKMANEDIIRNVRNLIKEFDIRPGKIEEKKGDEKPKFYFFIYGRRDLKTFKGKIGFLHPKRKDRLESHLKSYKKIYYRKGEAKKLIMNVLKENGKMTSFKIAEKLERNVDTIRDHLKKLREDGKIEVEIIGKEHLYYCR